VKEQPVQEVKKPQLPPYVKPAVSEYEPPTVAFTSMWDKSVIT